MASRVLGILTGGGSHLEERRAKTLVRSLSVPDEWLEQNGGSTDEVRVRRMRRLRGEALDQLELLEAGRR